MHIFDPNTGIETMNQNSGYTYVGSARTQADGTFITSPQKQLAISWHNRRPLNVNNGFSRDWQTNLNSWIEINPEIRAEFLTFGYGHTAFAQGWVSADTPGAIVDTAIGINGCGNIADGIARTYIFEADAPHGFSLSTSFGLLEAGGSGVDYRGHYFLTLCGRTSEGLATWGGGQTAGAGGGRTTINTMTEG